MPIRRAIYARAPRLSRPSAGRHEMPKAGLFSMPIKSLIPCAMRWMKPNAAVPDSRNGMMPMALPRKPLKRISPIFWILFTSALTMSMSRPGQARHWLARILKPSLPNLKARCAKRPLIWNLKRPPACAMRLSGWRPKSWDWMHRVCRPPLKNLSPARLK